MKLSIGYLVLTAVFATAAAAIPAQFTPHNLLPSLHTPDSGNGAPSVDPSQSEPTPSSSHEEPPATTPVASPRESPSVTFSGSTSSVESSTASETVDSTTPSASISPSVTFDPTPSSPVDSSTPAVTPTDVSTPLPSSVSPSSFTVDITSTADTQSSASEVSPTSASQVTSTPSSSTVESSVSSTAQEPSTTVSQSSGPTSTPSPPQVDRQTYLSTHNSIRGFFSAEPLTWSDDLQAKAQAYADQCQLKHSDGAIGPYGEHLAAATGNFDARSAVRLFAQDRNVFNPNALVLSHFTQIIWKSTKQLGCGVASCDNIFPGKGTATYHVCLYDPVGNVVGEERENLQLVF